MFLSSSLTCQYWTMLEKLARGKRSSLFVRSDSDEEKKFCKIDPRLEADQ